jgi:hypothetical protein
MPYDYQLVIGVILLAFSIVALLGDLAESRSPIRSVLVVLVSVGLVYWAWLISDSTLTPYSVPDSVFRIMSNWT